MRKLVKLTNELLAAYRGKKKDRINKLLEKTLVHLSHLKVKAHSRLDAGIISQEQCDDTIRAIELEESAISTGSYVQFATRDPFFHRILGTNITPAYIQYFRVSIRDEELR